MKKVFISVALLTMLGAMSVSCQKENIVDPVTGIVYGCTVYNIRYSIDGVLYNTTLHGNNEYDAFVRHLVGLARNGHSVVFWNTDKHQRGNTSKDVVVYTTTSEDDANRWAQKMIDEGYLVSISFDSQTKEYTCIARK